MSKEYGFYAKETAQNLGIKESTLRRWSLELEKEGYVFERNDKGENGHRIYFDHDILMLTDFQKMMKKTHNLKDATKLVMTMVRDRKNAERAMTVFDKEDDKISFTKDELQDFVKQLIEDTVAKTTAEIGKKMENAIEQRDKQLLQQLNESMEQRRIEVASAKEERKRPWWSSWFRKDEKEKSWVRGRS